MNIQTISTEQRKVTVELTADDLSMICDALCAQSKEKKYSDDFMQLYSDIMLVRNLCNCGRIDDFCLRNIVKCRNLKGILSEDDIEKKTERNA